MQLNLPIILIFTVEWIIDKTQERVIYIEEVCTEHGRDLKDIVLSWGCWFWIYENEKERNHYVDEIRRLADYGDQFQAIMGTPEEIIERFETLKEIGITYFTLRFEDLPSKRGLPLVNEYVMPEIY